METAASSKVTPLRDGDGAYRSPPHNIEAEQALLGAILFNNATYHRVSEFLLAEHFAQGVHGRIFAAITKLIERGQIANPVTLKSLFDQDEALAEIGGAQYLARLSASVVTVINAADYGRTIHDLYLRRQLIAIGEDTVNDAYSHDLERDARAQIETTEKKLFDLATSGQTEGGFRPFNQALTEAIVMAEAAFKRSGRTTGVSTGFNDLDKLLGGLHPSDLVILAGRPSMGKTALATNIGFNASKAYRTTRRGQPRGFRPFRPGEPEARLGAAVHRRHARPHHHRAAHPGAPPHAPARPGTHHRRLPAIAARRGRGPRRRESRAGDLGDHPRLEGARQGAQRSRAGAVAALACRREPRRQAPAARRPARIRLDRAGRRRGHVRLPRGILSEPRRANAADRGERRQVQRALRTLAQAAGRSERHR